LAENIRQHLLLALLIELSLGGVIGVPQSRFGGAERPGVNAAGC
jgi:hypothetical protein